MQSEWKTNRVQRLPSALPHMLLVFSHQLSNILNKFINCLEEKLSGSSILLLLLFFFFWPRSLQDLSYPTRNPTHAPLQQKCRVLTIEP